MGMPDPTSALSSWRHLPPAADVQALEPEQALLEVEAGVDATPRGRAVAAERAVTGDHPVARHEQADRAPADGTADGAGGARLPDPACDLAVARRRPAGDRAHAVEHPPVERREVADVHGDRREVHVVAVEE